jgi:hypothetical protein
MSSTNTASADRVLRAPKTDFTYWTYSTPHSGDCASAREARHMPIVLFAAGQASIGVDISSSGRMHSVNTVIKFFDRNQRRITYREWLRIWGPTLTKLFKVLESKNLNTTLVSSFYNSGSRVECSPIGLEISVTTSGRIASGSYHLLWEVPSNKRGQEHYPPFEYTRKCCPNYRMVWSEEKGEAVLQEVPRRKYSWESS